MTWDWTHVSRTIGEHSTHFSLIFIYILWKNRHIWTKFVTSLKSHRKREKQKNPKKNKTKNNNKKQSKWIIHWRRSLEYSDCYDCREKVMFWIWYKTVYCQCQSQYSQIHSVLVWQLSVKVPSIGPKELVKNYSPPRGPCAKTSFKKELHKKYNSTVSRDCRIHRLHHCRGVIPFPNNKCHGYDTKLSDGEAPVIMEL